MCEMIFTSGKEFDKIGEKETKRYFEESYNYICSYKNLGKNIISAVVHLDKVTPHIHLIYIPVIHTKDKLIKELYQDNLIRDFQKETNTFIDSQKQIKKKKEKMNGIKC